MTRLTPAYSRDYRSKNAVLEDFLANKDFVLNDIRSSHDGALINRPQIEADREGPVQVRYAKLSKVVTLKRDGDTWKAA